MLKIVGLILLVIGIILALSWKAYEPGLDEAKLDFEAKLGLGASVAVFAGAGLLLAIF